MTLRVMYMTLTTSASIKRFSRLYVSVPGSRAGPPTEGWAWGGGGHPRVVPISSQILNTNLNEMKLMKTAVDP